MGLYTSEVLLELLAEETSKFEITPTSEEEKKKIYTIHNSFFQVVNGLLCEEERKGMVTLFDALIREGLEHPVLLPWIHPDGLMLRFHDISLVAQLKLFTTKHTDVVFYPSTLWYFISSSLTHNFDIDCNKVRSYEAKYNGVLGDGYVEMGNARSFTICNPCIRIAIFPIFIGPTPGHWILVIAFLDRTAGIITGARYLCYDSLFNTPEYTGNNPAVAMVDRYIRTVAYWTQYSLEVGLDPIQEAVGAQQIIDIDDEDQLDEIRMEHHSRKRQGIILESVIFNAVTFKSGLRKAMYLSGGQTNAWECGYFLCKFIIDFLDLLPLAEALPLQSVSSKNNPVFYPESMDFNPSELVASHTWFLLKDLIQEIIGSTIA